MLLQQKLNIRNTKRKVLTHIFCLSFSFQVRKLLNIQRVPNIIYIKLQNKKSQKKIHISQLNLEYLGLPNSNSMEILILQDLDG